MSGSIDNDMRLAVAGIDALERLEAAKGIDARRIKPAAADAHGRLWHVVHVAAKFERQAADETSFVAKLIAEAGFEVYSAKLRRMIMPASKNLSHAQRKMRHLLARERIEPLFPGYEFVRFNPLTDNWHNIFAIVGIYGMLCENNLPVPMPNGFIEGLKRSEVNGAIPAALPIAEVFSLGETVRITKPGPFQGSTGPIERLDDAGRIRLLLDLFGGTVPTDMTFADIEKL
jgi:transcription antitermination factor NusG